jgi:CRP-like cAMP-binding protein
MAVSSDSLVYEPNVTFMSSVEPHNRLLAALPLECRERLLKVSTRVELPIRMQLFGNGEFPRHVYFLTSGIASVVFTSVRGTVVELATLGDEGLVGWNFLLGPLAGPMQCMLQVAGEGYRVPLAIVQREFAEVPEFRKVVLQFAQHQNILSNQIVACNRLHRAEARFARWLLMVQDRIHDDTIRMTQEFLSSMLGTRRTTVVEVAASLERVAAIENRRGIVRIVDRAKLQEHACECYPLLKQVLDELYKPDAQ